MLLYQTLLFYSKFWKNIKESYKNNKFKTSDPTLGEEFELPDGSYSISEIRDYFDHILYQKFEIISNVS